MKRFLRLTAALCVTALTVASLVSCASVNSDVFESLSDLEGHTLGIRAGSIYGEICDKHIKNTTKMEFIATPDLIQALKSNKIDAFPCDYSTAIALLSSSSGMKILGTLPGDDNYGFIFAKNAEGEQLKDKFNAFLASCKSDGRLDALIEKWIEGDSSGKVMEDYSSIEGENGTLIYATDTTMAPFDYISNEVAVGYEIELFTDFCKAYGYKPVVSGMNFSSIINSVSTGIASIGGAAISITEERAKSVYFSDIVFINTDVIMVNDSSATDSRGFFERIGDSFYSTFVKESRWKLILSGLAVTLEISILSLFFGTIIGFGLCLLRLSKKKWLSSLTGGFINLIRGVPVLVLLMVLYFIIFSSPNISGIFISVVGFSLNFGVFVSEMMRSGINSVDSGQRDAACALGFGRAGAFIHIVLPQAARITLPVYRGEFVSMVKMTSVVGYIAVQDLTKMSDVIRSCTYEAFFPLFSTALIYLALIALLTFFLGRLEKRLDSKKLPRKLRKLNLSALGTVRPENAVSGSDETVISVRHLKKSFGNVSPISDISFDVKRGDIISVIGPSGTGKSTLLKCLNLLEKPTAGSITVFGTDVVSRRADVSAVRRKMGMVFQSFNLFPHLTVLENITLAPVCLLKTDFQDAAADAMRLLREVGLAEKALSYPDELSGGQKQRIAIARALAMHPEAVLFDEPTSALDPTMTGEVLTVIRSLADKGLTMLIVTHEMRFAKSIATRVFYLDEGTVYEEGSPEKIFDSPSREKTRIFTRRLRLLNRTVTSRDFDFIGFNGDIERFCRQSLISQKDVYRAELCFEELAVQTVIPALPESFSLDITLECSDDGMSLSLVWSGAELNPAVMADELSKRLIEGASESVSYGYEDGVNTVTVTF